METNTAMNRVVQAKKANRSPKKLTMCKVMSCIILKSRRVSISIPLARHHHVTVPFLKSRNSFRISSVLLYSGHSVKSRPVKQGITFMPFTAPRLRSNRKSSIARSATSPASCCKRSSRCPLVSCVDLISSYVELDAKERTRSKVCKPRWPPPTSQRDRPTAESQSADASRKVVGR
jgi:hypothetical protein